MKKWELNHEEVLKKRSENANTQSKKEDKKKIDLDNADKIANLDLKSSADEEE